MIRYARLDFRCDFLMNKMKKYNVEGIEYDIQLAKVIDSLPVNYFYGMNKYEILKRDGYVKNSKDGDKRVLFNEDSCFYGTHCEYVHISEIDDSRPWTIIDDGEFGLILYLDNFEKVNEKYNYYKYKDEYYEL